MCVLSSTAPRPRAHSRAPLSTQSTTVNGPLITSLASATAAATALSAAAAATSSSSLVAAAAALSDTLASAAASAATLGATLGTASTTLAARLCLARSPGCPVDAATARNTVAYGVWAVLGGGVGVAIIHGVFLCKNRAAACCFRCTAPLMLAVGVLTPILGAAFYAVALAGSDACGDPAAALAGIVNGTSPLAAATIAYSAACGVPGAAVPPAGALALAAAAAAALGDPSAGALAQLAAFNASVASSGASPAEQQALLGPLGDLTWALGRANASAAALAAAVGCAPTATVFFALANGLCTGGVSGAIKTLFAIGGGVGAVFGLLLVSVRACWQRACWGRRGVAAGRGYARARSHALALR